VLLDQREDWIGHDGTPWDDAEQVQHIARGTEMDYPRYSQQQVDTAPTDRPIDKPTDIVDLAVLFYQSGWTQEKLAKKETEFTGKKVSRSCITRRLLFGQFLNFVPMGTNTENPPIGLTERRFRDIWAETDKAETGGNKTAITTAYLAQGNQAAS
jgi:hypothetical protein